MRDGRTATLFRRCGADGPDLGVTRAIRSDSRHVRPPCYAMLRGVLYGYGFCGTTFGSVGTTLARCVA